MTDGFIFPALRVIALLVLTSAFGQAIRAQAPAPAPAPTPADIRVRVTQLPVDSTVSDDANVNKMLEAYAPKVRALESPLAKLKGDLRKGGVGAGSMGNFVTDGMRAQASQKLGQPILLAVTNGGGLRKNTIAEGVLRTRDMFELLPFENALVAFDLTGAQVLDLLRGVVGRRDAQSGAIVRYKLNAGKRPELISARFLVNGKLQEINPAATYTVISIDYLLRVTGGDYAVVLKQAKNTRPLGLTMRDAMISYVKAETAAGREINAAFDGRFVFDGLPESQPEETTP